MCALAKDGMLFERAYTTSTSTTPAIASMLTGLYPHRTASKQLFWLLPPAMTTLAERAARRAAIAAAAFVSSFVMVRDFSGFEQGFDIYDDDVRSREAFRATTTSAPAARRSSTPSRGCRRPDRTPSCSSISSSRTGPTRRRRPTSSASRCPPDGTPVPATCPHYQR